MTLEKDDHDILIRLDENVGHIKETIDEIKREKIDETGVYKITTKVLKEHCNSKHPLPYKKSGFNWGHVARISTVTLPPIIGAIIISLT